MDTPSNSLSQANSATSTESKVFEKYKSWYKVDIDGAFITKNYDTTWTAPKKRKPYKVRKKIVVQNLPYKTQTKDKILYRKPKGAILNHKVILDFAVQLLVVLIFILMTYCGYIYIVPFDPLLLTQEYLNNNIYDGIY